MSELSKQALLVENNQSFPNNNAGLITPSALRTFNEDMIDSTVNQTTYTADSASFDSRINNITGSATNTGSLLTTASFSGNTLTFTKGDNSTFGVVIPDVSGSVLPPGVISGSAQLTGSFVTLDTTQVITNRKLFAPSPDGAVGIAMQNATRLTFGSVGTNRISSPDSNTLNIETINSSPVSGSPNTINLISGVNGQTGGNGSIINIQTKGAQADQEVAISSSLVRVSGNTVVNGPLTASRLQINGITDLNGVLDVSNDATFRGDVLIQSSGEQKFKMRSTSGGGVSQGFDLLIETSSFIIRDETHDIDFLEFDYIPSNGDHILKLEANRFEMNSGSLGISGSLTASLQEGYAWVGDSSGRTQEIPTSSFGGGGTGNGFPFSGSAVITGSLSVSETIKSQVYMNPQTLDGFTIPTGNNAMLVGPVAVSGSIVVEGNSNLLVLSQITSSATPLPSGVVSGSSQLTSSYDLRYALSGSGGGTIETGSFATTGSNTFIGDQTITGSLYLSSSNEIVFNVPNFPGQPAPGGLSVTGSMAVNGNFAVNGGGFTVGQVNTPKIVGQGGTLQIVSDVLVFNDSGFGTPKNLGVSGSAFISGSVNLRNVLNLEGQDPLPSGNIGDLAVSGSSLFFYNGAWTLVV